MGPHDVSHVTNHAGARICHVTRYTSPGVSGIGKRLLVRACALLPYIDLGGRRIDSALAPDGYAIPPTRAVVAETCVGLRNIDAPGLGHQRFPQVPNDRYRPLWKPFEPPSPSLWSAYQMKIFIRGSRQATYSASAIHSACCSRRHALRIRIGLIRELGCPHRNALGELAGVQHRVQIVHVGQADVWHPAEVATWRTPVASTLLGIGRVLEIRVARPRIDWGAAASHRL